MKMKSLIAATAASLLLTSVIHAAPATGMEDDDGSGLTQQNLAVADNGNNTNIGAVPGPNGAPSSDDNATGTTPDNMQMSDNNSNSNTNSNANSNSNDDMSADTATGDDDY
jgi:hypothetical protein